MAVFRVEKNKGYTVMSNHHLRNKELSLKAKGVALRTKRKIFSYKIQKPLLKRNLKKDA